MDRKKNIVDIEYKFLRFMISFMRNRKIIYKENEVISGFTQRQKIKNSEFIGL